MEPNEINIILDFNRGDGYTTYHIDIVVSSEEEVFILGDVHSYELPHPKMHLLKTIDISIVDRIIGVAIRNRFFDKPYLNYTPNVLDGSDCELSIIIGNKERKIRDYAESAPKYIQEIKRLIEKHCISERYYVKRKPRICMKCEGKKILDIIYGEPSTETFLRATKGEVIIAGCCFNEYSPRWTCDECGSEYLKER